MNDAGVLTKLHHLPTVAWIDRLPKDSRFLLLDEKADVAFLRKTFGYIAGFVQPWQPLTQAQHEDVMNYARALITPGEKTKFIDLLKNEIMIGAADDLYTVEPLPKELPEGVRIIQKGLTERFVAATGGMPDNVFLHINGFDYGDFHRHGESLTYAQNGDATMVERNDVSYLLPAQHAAFLKKNVRHKAPTTIPSLENPRLTYVLDIA